MPRKALLLGLDTYEDTSPTEKGLKLTAPKNDVALMSETLIFLGYRSEGIAATPPHYQEFPSKCERSGRAFVVYFRTRCGSGRPTCRYTGRLLPRRSPARKPAPERSVALRSGALLSGCIYIDSRRCLPRASEAKARVGDEGSR